MKIKVGSLIFDFESKANDMGNWKLALEDGEEFCGTGIIALRSTLHSLDTRTKWIVFVKRLKVFWIFARNKGLKFTENSLVQAKDNSNSYDFFLLKTGGNIELRNWDNWFDKIEEPKEFIQTFYKAKEILGIKIDVDKPFRFNLTSKIRSRLVEWENKDYIGYNYRNSLREEVAATIPDSEELLNLFENYYRGGMTGYNLKAKNYGVIPNVFSYDKKSCHLAAMCNRKFPYKPFKEIDGSEFNSYQRKATPDSSFCFIGIFTFEDFREKEELKGFIWKFIKGAPNNWSMVINENDWYWIKDIAMFKNFKCKRLWVSQKKYLRKNFINALFGLYERKNAAEKGTVERLLYKTATELPYGNSIRRIAYEYEGKINGNGDVEINEKDELTFEEKQQILLKRYIPYPVGVWTVSYSRADIWEGIKTIGYSSCVYWDTDCIKTTNPYAGQLLNVAWNNRMFHAENVVGIPYSETLGKWDLEYKADKFKIIGLKWYLYEENGKRKARCSGASIKVFDKWLETHGIDEFDEDTVIEGLVGGTFRINDKLEVIKQEFNTYVGFNESELYGILEVS